MFIDKQLVDLHKVFPSHQPKAEGVEPKHMALAFCVLAFAGFLNSKLIFFSSALHTDLFLVIYKFFHAVPCVVIHIPTTPRACVVFK